MESSKVIVITGAAHGIGEATVLKFLKSGYIVAACDLDAAGLEHLKAVTSESGFADKLYTFEVNTSKKELLLELSQKIFNQFGRIDALFANAGIHRSNKLLTIEDSELELMINTNIYGTVYTLQAFMPYMVEAKQGAVVINSSDQFYVGKQNNFAYGMTKGAIGQIVRSLAADYAEFNIRVNAVCPGTVDTPLAQDALARYAKRSGKTMAEVWDEENSLFLLKRVGKADEIANMVYFIVEEATFSTGAFFSADGGLSAV